MGSSLPPEVESQAHEAYAPFKGKTIAVRSSAHGEDSAKLSFAGQLSTFLFVKSKEEALQKSNAIKQLPAKPKADDKQ